MSKRFTDTEKFNDKWYRKLPILQKVIWEYLLSECNYAGILEKFDIELMSFKIGAEISRDDLKIFADRIIFISDSVLFIPKFLNFQYGDFNPKNKVHISVLRELDKYNIATPWAVRRRSVDGSKEKDKDKDKDKDKKKNKDSKFIKPTISEIKDYCIERNNNLDVNRFYDFYESKGWLVGKVKMKDWRAAVRTWERNNSGGRIEKVSNNRNKQIERTQEFLKQCEADRIASEKNPINLTEFKKKLDFLAT